MPTGRKQKHKPIVKVPSEYFHPSLNTRSTLRKFGEESASSSTVSVNEQIEHLRRTQNVHTPRSVPGTLDASVHARLHVPRRTAGPPPPRSWLINSGLKNQSSLKVESQKSNSFDELPGLNIPERLSLTHQVLRTMAQDFDSHVEYDHFYLSTLPDDIKIQLLSYVAAFGQKGGISLAGLKSLFPSIHESGLSPVEGRQTVSRLDLSGALGWRISLRQLQKFWMIGKYSHAREKSITDVVESWDQDIDLRSLSLESPLRFPQLTHLSLSHPHAGISWTEFLSFSRQLGALTHLSLASWPPPRLPLAATAPDYQSGEISSNVDAEASYLLKMLSRNTSSLQWLSLASCQSWFSALRPPPSTQSGFWIHPEHAIRETGLPRPPRRSRAVQFDDSFTDTQNEDPGPEWTDSWRHMRYIRLSHEPLPLDISVADLKKLHQLRRAEMQVGIPPEVDRITRRRREIETYRIFAPDSVLDALEAGEKRVRWEVAEEQALQVAAWVRHVRRKKGLARCEFDYGWGRKEALDAGYDEHVLFEAGL